MDLVLRPVRPGDRDFIYATRHEGFRAYAEAVWGPWDEAHHQAAVDRDVREQPFEIVERAGVAVGYRCVLRHADHWFLDEIAVVAGERGRGLGGRLVRDLCAEVTAAGCELRLSVLEVNPAQRLYARLGFRVTRVAPPRVAMAWP